VGRVGNCISESVLTPQTPQDHPRFQNIIITEECQSIPIIVKDGQELLQFTARFSQSHVTTEHESIMGDCLVTDNVTDIGIFKR